jgi:chromosome segregation ATPase
MSENKGDLETVSKKFVNLDSEIDSFLRTIREINQIREDVEEFPGRLKKNETEIEDQKKRVDSLVSSTNNLLITFEEKSKGVLFDLERKTNVLAGEVKSGISELEALFSKNSSEFKDRDRGKINKVLIKQGELNDSFKSLKKQVNTNGQSINILKNSYAAVSGIFEKLETSFNEMKKNIVDLQRRPYEVENKTVETEERLIALIDENYSRQKIFMWMLLAGVIASIGFSFSVFYLQ